MPNLNQIRQSANEAMAMSAMFAPVTLLSDRVVLTKSGDLFMVLSLEGRDPECLEPAEVAAITQRFAAFERSLGPEYRVYQYLIKQHSPAIPLGPPDDSVQQHRWLYLAGRGREIFSVRLYLVILRSRPAVGTDWSLARFSIGNQLQILGDQMHKEISALSVAVGSAVAQLSDVGPEVLNGPPVLSFLRSLVNVEPWKANVGPVARGRDLDRQMAQSSLEVFRTHLEQDGQRMKVLSLVDLPAMTVANMLRGLMSIPCNTVVCLQWKREPNSLVRGEINKRRRHYHLGKSSMLSFIGDHRPRADEVLIDDSKSEVVTALNGALTEMEMNENHFGRFALTITISDEDPATLNRAAAKVSEAFAAQDARLIDESYNLLNAYLAQVPGNYAYQQRWMWAMNLNHSDLALLFAPSEGQRWNPHLDAPFLNLLETNERTLYHLNLHYQDVGHTLLLGSIGSGKSFLTNFLTASYQRYNPYTAIFDLGGSYKRLTAHYGGSYQHVGHEGAFVINPFALPDTPENREFQFQFIRVLAERDGYEMGVEERQDLVACIADLYHLDPAQRRLGTLAAICHRSYRQRLAEWSGDGRLGRYFDHEQDNLTMARFQAFDFERVEDKAVLEAMLFYILHRVNHTVYSPTEQATAKFIVFDEAWRFFRHPVTRDYIREALKTWRKRNALMLLATQSGDDLNRSELLPVIAESAFTRIFLANPGMDPAQYREAFHLNSVEAAHIMSLQPKRQFLLKQPHGSKVLNLLVDEESRRLFSIGGK